MSSATPAQSSQSSRLDSRRRGWLHLSVLVAYALITAILTWPLVLNLTSAIPGDGFDGWQNYWNLWWVKLALVDRLQNPLFTDILYYPTGVGLYFHTLNPFNGLITLPVQLTAGLIAAYNTVVFISWVLGGYGVFLLTLWVLGPGGRRLVIDGGGGRAKNEERRTKSEEQRTTSTGGRYWVNYAAAFVAGAIFTFAPFHMAHLLGHMQVMSLQWIAFYMLTLLMAMRALLAGRAWLHYTLMSALFLVFTGLCDWYFVLYLIFFTAIALLWMGTTILIRGRQKAGSEPSSKRGWVDPLISLIWLSVPALLAGLLFFVTLSFWLVPMVRQARQFDFMVRPQSDLYILSASLMDFLVPNRLHTLFRPASFSWIGNQVAPISERTLTVGYIPLVLAIIGVFMRTRRALFWAVMALLFLMLALGPIIHLGNITWDDIPAQNDVQFHMTPMGVLNYLLPIARISRSISRFALMVQLSLAVLAGLGTAALLAHLRSGRMAVAVSVLLLVLVLAEFWVAPYPLSPPDTPDYYSEVLAPGGGDGAVLNLPMNYDRPGYLLYQTVHQRPLAVAYISRDDSRTLTERIPLLQHFRHLGPDIIDIDPALVGRTVLHDLGVDTVVLDRYKMPGGDERLYTTALAEATFADEEPLFEDDRITVFTVTAPEIQQPYPLLGEKNWGALESTEDGAGLQRLIGGPASLHLRHLPDDAQLRLRYRTEPGATLTLSMDANGERLSTLPPAPEGAEVLLERLPPAAMDGSAEATVTLTPSDPESVWVESITLVVE